MSNQNNFNEKDFVEEMKSSPEWQEFEEALKDMFGDIEQEIEKEAKRRRMLRYAGYAAGAAAIVGVGYLAYRHFSASDAVEVATSTAAEIGTDVLEASVNYF